MDQNSTIVLFQSLARVVGRGAIVAALLLFHGCGTVGSSSTLDYRLADQEQVCRERRCIWIENGVSYCSCNINSRAY